MTLFGGNSGGAGEASPDRRTEMEKTVFARIYSPWHSFIGGLDSELVNIGFGKEVVLWNSHKPFTGDNFYRLYLPVKGAFRLNYMNESVVVEPGSIHLVPAHTPFTYESMTPSDHYWLHFLSKQLRTVPAFQSHRVLPVENLKKKRFEFEKMFRQIRTARTVSDDLRIRNGIFVLLAPFLESALHELPQDAASKGGFTEVLEYIDRNLAKEINIAALSSLTQLSRADFSSLFRRSFGVPPKQYISLRRISRAKYLLWRTKLSVKEIAEQCGYENKYFFYRIFKKYTGVTPSQYRRIGSAD